MNINWYLSPTRFKRFRKLFGRSTFKLLDVGVAANSVALAKRWLPNCEYYGLDITDKYLTAGDKAKMAGFIMADLESDDLQQLEDGYFDAIVFSHVIEHLRNGDLALGRLARKLAPGGHIYVEFPSVRSLNLPRARHTLNFSDDETHIRVYDVKDVANVLMEGGLRIIRGGRRREWIRITLCFLSIPLQVMTYVKEGRLDGTGLWDIMGFADFVYARRPALPEQGK